MRKRQDTAASEVSESEQLLFGGPLRYDMGWNQHGDAFLELDFRAMMTRLPGMLASSLRLARQADARAARIVLASQVGVGAAQAVSLLAVNSVLGRLIGTGTIEERLRGAAPALVTMAAVLFVAALLRAASTYATGRLEPKVEVRHEAPLLPGRGERPLPPGCRSGPVKLRAADPWRRTGRQEQP